MRCTSMRKIRLTVAASTGCGPLLTEFSSLSSKTEMQASFICPLELSEIIYCPAGPIARMAPSPSLCQFGNISEGSTVGACRSVLTRASGAIDHGQRFSSLFIAEGTANCLCIKVQLFGLPNQLQQAHASLHVVHAGFHATMHTMLIKL